GLQRRARDHPGDRPEGDLRHQRFPRARVQGPSRAHPPEAATGRGADDAGGDHQDHRRARGGDARRRRRAPVRVRSQAPRRDQGPETGAGGNRGHRLGRRRTPPDTAGSGSLECFNPPNLAVVWPNSENVTGEFVELDRHFIERNDFSAARRGYDPDEADRHLRGIADAVAELKRSARRSPSSIAASAAEQVRGIVEAAERSAAEIQEQAESEAKRIVDDAAGRARETRERADADAVERISKAEEASNRMLERTGTVEGEIDRLLGEMR